jgi:hypothetical protein
VWGESFLYRRAFQSAQKTPGKTNKPSL